MNDIILIEKLNGRKTFQVGNNENKTFIIFSHGKTDQNTHISIIIRGRNAKVQILGLVLGNGNQELNIFTLQDHRREESVSDLLVKSVLFDRSKLFYEGLIKIAKNAQKSNAYQKNQNILMSPYSWADSRPKLEILANDVRCTHGATVGKIDSEILYYLKTRGLTEKEAEFLVIKGFFKEVLDRIPDPEITGYLTEKIDKKISNLLKIN